MCSPSHNKETYIASFFSHIGAIRFHRLCRERNWASKMMPVPRALSSSCGTCVSYQGDGSLSPEMLSDEVEQIARVTDVGYEVVYRALGV